MRPPFTLTLAWSRPRSVIAAIVTHANASLISYRSTSPGDQPIFLLQFFDGRHRRCREPLRFMRVPGVTDEARQRLQAALFGFTL